MSQSVALRLIINKILLLGASGTGTTSTAKLIAEKLEWFHGDSDSYFWEPTEPPFDKIRPVATIEELLKKDLKGHTSIVFSGSFCGWGDIIVPELDYVFFFEAPVELRIQRIRERESLRFGQKIEPGGSRYETFQNFLNWSRAYDAGGVSRTRKLHEDWLSQHSLPHKIVSTDRPQNVVVKEILKMISSC